METQLPQRDPSRTPEIPNCFHHHAYRVRQQSTCMKHGIGLFAIGVEIVWKGVDMRWRTGETKGRHPRRYAHHAWGQTTATCPKEIGKKLRDEDKDPYS